MAGPKSCLGYPTRTDAILALRGQGLATRDIARRIGIEPKTVTALEASAARRGGNHRPRGRQEYRNVVPVDPETLAALRPHAVRRHISVDLLIQQLLMILVDDDLVDALLDDDEDSN
jgi:hypothetical protein